MIALGYLFLSESIEVTDRNNAKTIGSDDAMRMGMRRATERRDDSGAFHELPKAADMPGVSRESAGISIWATAPHAARKTNDAGQPHSLRCVALDAGA